MEPIDKELTPLSFKEKHGSAYPCYAPGGGTYMGSLRTYAAQQIDSSWHHSWYWKDEKWVDDAIESAFRELTEASERVDKLTAIIRLLKRSQL